MSIQNLIEIAVENNMISFGLRVMTDKPNGETILLSVGDDIENSFEWVDGNTTDEQIDGVSTIGFDVDQIDGEIDLDSYNHALRGINQYGNGQVVVVGGIQNVDAIHNDIGELVIKNATVVAVIN